MKLDKRRRYYRNRYMTLGKITLGVLIALVMYSILSFSIRPRPLISPLSDVQPVSEETKAQIVEDYKDVGFGFERIKVEAIEPACDFDPITYIRCRGEELGVSNQDIMTMIRIARAESNFNPTAKNKNSTASGVMQFLDGSFKYYGCSGDKLNFVDSINCGYKAFLKDGFRPWAASSSKWL